MGYESTPKSKSIVSTLEKLSPNALLYVHLNELMEVMELVVVQIMGFVEDERNFLTVTFMKTRLQNMICEHF